MKTICLFVYLTVIFCVPVSCQSTKRVNDSASIDLTKITHIQPKGRVQDKDYNNLEVVNQLLARRVQAVPFLIGKLTDETQIKSKVLDYWYKITVGDIALVILTDFFTDSTWTKSTIPAVAWDVMLEGKENKVDSERMLRQFIAKHGRKAIQQKWMKVWNQNNYKIFWDEQENCFNLK